MPSTFVYSTVFPGGEAYLKDWYESVLSQSHADFELCIGQDEIGIEQVKQSAGYEIGARWFPGARGATLADVRNDALIEIAHNDGIVIVVDSDDMLAPTRVEYACDSVKNADVSACALELIEQDGTRTGDVLRLQEDTAPNDVLPRHNMFGLSNSTWRTQMLRRCLPIPSEAKLVDWYLITQAWLFDARLDFDPRVGMLYRQHDRSSARVRPPFDVAQVARDTDKVCLHFDLVHANLRKGHDSGRKRELSRVRDDVRRFRDTIVSRAGALNDYVAQLNESSCGRYWWESVAFQSLAHLWR